MTDEKRDFLRDAWFPVGLCVIGLFGLIVRGIVYAVPYVVTAIAAALN